MAYKILVDQDQMTPDSLRKAQYLGWCVEMVSEIFIRMSSSATFCCWHSLFMQYQICRQYLDSIRYFVATTANVSIGHKIKLTFHFRINLIYNSRAITFPILTNGFIIIHRWSEISVWISKPHTISLSGPIRNSDRQYHASYSKYISNIAGDVISCDLLFDVIKIERRVNSVCVWNEYLKSNFLIMQMDVMLSA